jgi:hypothetical protein
MSKMPQNTFVIQVEEPAAMVKSVKDILIKKGYDAKIMQGTNFSSDVSMDALQVVRITHDDYPRGCEIILIAMY